MLHPPEKFFWACRRHYVALTRWCLVVSVQPQRMFLFKRNSEATNASMRPIYQLQKQYVISTSRFGVGQQSGSNQTPLGLHRIAEKIGRGHPIGTVFSSRLPIGLTWQGMPDASIVHRIFWLDGLEPGFNRGGQVDTHARYVYIHGYGDELTLGKPKSCGCVHLAAADIIPLSEKLPSGTLVWIQ